MIEVQGDFFDLAAEMNPDAIVCTINEVIKLNGELVMGAGIAKAFRDKIPGLANRWGNRTLHKNPGDLIIDTLKNVYAIGLPTKIHWRDPSEIDFVVSSLVKLKQFVDENNLEKVMMTRPGCGNGGLSWDTVKAIMKEDIVFDDRFIIVER